jgi:hypothetical protein
VAGTGRYVRVNGTARGATLGYSLWEFGVYQNLTLPKTSAPGRPLH